MNEPATWRATSRRGSAAERESGEDHEPWLISYADMMTLLVGLFAMMFSFASFDEASVKRMDEALSSTFGQTTNPVDQRERIKTLSGSIRSAMFLTPYFDDMQIKETPEGLEVSFGTSSLFASGSAQLTDQATHAMLSLAERIRSMGDKTRIKVEGHTDDVPVVGGRYESNWLLSSARAATIIGLFESVHIPSDRLEASGLGSSRPAYPNRNADGQPIPENQARNRRVVVKIRLDS